MRGLTSSQDHQIFQKLEPNGIIQVGTWERWDNVKKEKYNVFGIYTRNSPIENFKAGYTAYYLRKFIDPSVYDQYTGQSCPFRYIRYGEVLLNYVEACIELNQDQEAKTYLNIVQKRAGMPAFTETGAALRARYRNKRRIELAMEDHRFYDVRGLLIAPSAYVAFIVVNVVYKLQRDNTTATIPTITPIVVQKSAWEDKVYYLPIMRNEIDKNNILVKTPDTNYKSQSMLINIKNIRNSLKFQPRVMSRYSLRVLSILMIIIICSYSPTNKKDRLDGIYVPEGYILEIAAGEDLVDYPMFSTLDETGRLFVFESIGSVYDKTQDAIDNPAFRIKLLIDSNNDGKYDKSTIFADKIGFPQGGVFHNGSLYASSAPDLLKLTDTDNDGVADKREVLLTGWTLNVNANSLIGPFMAPDGWLYMSSAIMGFDVNTKEGKRLKGETSRIWRFRPDGSGLEWISAGGMNNPVELTFTESAEPIGTETYFTDPMAGQRDALVYWTEGGVYPKPNKNIDRDSLVRTGDLMPVVSKYSRVAPSGIGRYRNTVFGDGFKNNLFSAQFNTHKIIRHKLLRDGGSFRTEDEDFFWTDNEDSHPTDVLEDADGSLLVVETGGWFIKGCPLSQVSKPELKGAIYRIRKKDVKKTQDPYGNSINWPVLSSSQTSKYLEDKRPFVTDRAVNTLVSRGDSSVIDLTKIIQNSISVDARTKAVFALYRIGSPKSMESVRLALSDSSIQVQVAAARSVGLAKDKLAGNKLKSLLKTKNAVAVQRQVASALGQIGDVTAIPILLKTAGATQDRFLQHAAIYSLINLKKPELVAKGLESKSSGEILAALTVLDQMGGAYLKARQAISQLTSMNEKLRTTALWVISHHPEWASDVEVFLTKRLQQGELTAVEQKSFKQVLVSLSTNASMQNFIASKTGIGSKQTRLFFLSVMEETPLEVFPENWVQQVNTILSGNAETELKMEALSLVKLRRILAAEKAVSAIAEQTNSPVTLKINSLATLIGFSTTLNDQNFAFLVNQLRSNKTDVSQKLQVASILEQARLTNSQLDHLASDLLPNLDSFVLPRLISVFSGPYSSDIGKRILATLNNSSILDSYSEATLRKLFSQYPAELKPEVEKLVTKLNRAQAERLQYLKSLEDKISTGNIENGRKLFFGKAVCWACHTVGSDGGNLGPDLTSIQKDRSTHDLLEAIVYPNASFVREFETYKVKTKSTEHLGIIKEKLADAIILHTSAQTTVRIPKADILSMEIHDISMMPQGLDKAMSQQEISDLMAFLMGQDQDPDTDKALLR